MLAKRPPIFGGVAQTWLRDLGYREPDIVENLLRKVCAEEFGFLDTGSGTGGHTLEIVQKGRNDTVLQYQGNVHETLDIAFSLPNIRGLWLTPTTRHLSAFLKRRGWKRRENEWWTPPRSLCARCPRLLDCTLQEAL